MVINQPLLLNLWLQSTVVTEPLVINRPLLLNLWLLVNPCSSCSHGYTLLGPPF